MLDRIALVGLVALSGPASPTATLRVQDAAGHDQAQPVAPVGLGETLRLRLVVPGDAATRPAMAINPSPLSVTVSPSLGLTTHLSSDGRFLDVAPASFYAPETAYTLTIHGAYREQAGSWLLDRLNPFARAGSFDATIPFTTSPRGPKPLAGQIVTWGASQFQLHQPDAFQAEHPALLDGLAVALVAPEGVRPDGTLALAGLPARPGPDGVKVLADPTRVFMLTGHVQDGWVRATGQLGLPARGGNLTFESFVARGRLGPDGTLNDGEFTAVLPALGLLKSGQPYSFPASRLHEVADPQLRLIALGAFTGGPIAPALIPARMAKVDRTPTGLALTLSVAPKTGEHLLTALAVGPDGQPTAIASAHVGAGQAGPFPLTWPGRAPRPDARIHVLFDAIPMGTLGAE